MTKEQINILNEKCVAITIDGESNFVSSDFIYNTFSIKDYNGFKILMKNLEDKSKIKSIVINKGELLLDEIKELQGLESISCSFNLDLNTLKKIMAYFPNIKTLSFNTIDLEVYDNYEKFDIEIITSDPKYNLSSNNICFWGLNKFAVKKYGYLEIKIPFNEDLYKDLFNICKTIGTLSLRDGSFEQYIDVVNFIKEKNIKVRSIYINVKNQNYEDIDKLKELENEGSEIFLSYNDGWATIEEFKNMRATLNYYVDLIKDANLSPVEQVMYAYDLVKSIDYKKEEEGQDFSISRKVSGFVNEGLIVCVGYTKLLSQILKELGIEMFETLVAIYDENLENLTDDQLYNPNNEDFTHSRGIIRIDDEKYDIHGVFSLDATGDRNGKEDSGLDWYYYFLIPLKKYKEKFKNDSFPILFSHFLKKIKPKNKTIFERFIMAELEKFALPINLEHDELKNQLKSFFDGKDFGEEYEKVMQTEGLTRKQFKEILRNVRMAEGYPEYMIKEEIVRVSYLNGYNPQNIKQMTEDDWEIMKLLGVELERPKDR